MTLAPPVEAVRIGPTGVPELTLGWQVIDWCLGNLMQPDGPDAGEPWRFTDEQARFLLWWYAIDERGRFLYRSGTLRRMKGWGKDPLGAALCAAEFVGPCRFDGFRDGEPQAAPHHAAWVQTAAVAKEQTRNTMTLFPGMLSKPTIAEHSIDLGKEIIYAHHGRCRIEAVTSSPRALEGGRATFVLANETQHWLQNNEGLAMQDVIARNAGKSRDGSSRVLAITNAHRLGEGSAAERDWEAWQKSPDGILYDSLSAPEGLSTEEREDIEAGLTAARGDSHWLDVERLTGEILDPRTSESLARRYYFNQIRAETDSWLRKDEWDACVSDAAEPEPGRVVTLGFDGSRTRDATALVGTDVETGYQWVIRVWQRPDVPGEWEVPVVEVNATVEEAMSRWRVWRLSADPYWWTEQVAAWSARWEGKVASWNTTRLHPMARAVKAYEQAVQLGELTHADDERFAEHIANAVKRETGFRDEDGEPMYVISKDGKGSPRKIDIAMAAVLSWEARGLALAAGALQPKPTPRAFVFEDSRA